MSLIDLLVFRQQLKRISDFESILIETSKTEKQMEKNNNTTLEYPRAVGQLQKV